MVVLRIVASLIALWDFFLLVLNLEGDQDNQPTAIGSVVIAIGIAALPAALIALFGQPALAGPGSASTCGQRELRPLGIRYPMAAQW
jgi:hypothetical protein